VAWSRVQSASGGPTAGTSATITLGQSPVQGNKLIVLAGTDSVSGATFTATLGATSLVNISGAQQFNDAGEVSGAVFVVDVPVSPSSTITITSNQAGASVYGYAIEVSGLLAGTTTAIIDGGAWPAPSHGGTTTYSGPSYTTTASNEFLIGTYTDNGGPTTYAAAGGYTLDPTSAGPPPTSAGINSNASGDSVIVYKNSTGGAESAPFSLSGSAAGWISNLAAFKLAAAPAAGMTFRAQPGQAWLRHFHHRQTLSPPGPAPAVTPVSGQVQPWPTVPLPRRRPGRAVIEFTPVTTQNARPPGTTQPWPTIPVPRLRPSRVLWRAGQGSITPQGVTQPWPTIPVPRRKPALAVIEFTPVTTVNQVITGVAVPAPVQLPVFPRRVPARAFVRFTPVTTVNAGISGQVQPWATIPIPRRKPARSFVQFTPVTTVNQVTGGVAVPPPLMLARFPRRKPSRALTSITLHPVRTTNAAPVAAPAVLNPLPNGGSIEGALWEMARTGQWPKRPPGFGPVGPVPSSGAVPPAPGERGWVGKKKRRFFWPKQDE